jgi:pimeloyl-ACP methyl ester carboxylesterase
MTASATLPVTLTGTGPVPVSYTDRGAGAAVVLLHGGAGPQSVTAFADLLAQAGPARVIVPVHPGFAGTVRPASLRSPSGLARLYTAMLDQLDLTAVTVIGNSMGGWIAAEMALAGSARIAGAVLVDAVGIEVPGHPVADFFSLTMDQVADLSYHDPGRFLGNLAAMTPEQQAAMAGNRQALADYAGSAMTDETLRGRLEQVSLPVRVVWGDSDRMADPDYGRAFAAAIPGAEFRLLRDTGHVPQLESPDQLLDAILEFTGARAAT